MQRHILDKPRAGQKPSLDRALKIAKQDVPNRTTLALQQRPRAARSAARTLQFQRIAKEGGA